MNKISHELFENRQYKLEQLAKIAKGQSGVSLQNEDTYVNYINKGANFLQNMLEKEGAIYGVTTGFGDSCDVVVSEELAKLLPRQLYTFHGCGTGELLSKEVARCVMAVRLASLAKGVSGVRYCLLEKIAELINKDIVPVIPEEGSVGASGDLTPLSYVAAVLCGERQVYYQGEIKPTADVFALENIQALTLKPKEGLAIMNGTAVMTAMSVIAFQRAEYLAKLCARITALATIGLGSNIHHFNEFLFSVKPHEGQAKIAGWIRADLGSKNILFDSHRLQERYSIRCAPHVIGVLQDMLPWYKNTIENEISSANDNPIIDAEAEVIYHGGHFYGGHICFAMDGMKNNVANLSDLLDRQMALLVDTKFNHGLPRNLTGATGAIRTINHGFKAVQIACSAWTAEALKLTMPASAFSRSTESHNQDKVSMGTIAAKDCLRVLELTEQTAAAMLMATVQAINLRAKQNELELENMQPQLQKFIANISEHFDFLGEDRQLDREIIKLRELISQQSWGLYD
ncbi:MAG: aromatic amino acid ammonia-lyase [Proteobacteria bacterium]|nr:aromatic amino acid ammonia-lyase [Pseudomonadota bacterium]